MRHEASDSNTLQEMDVVTHQVCQAILVATQQQQQQQQQPEKGNDNGLQLHLSMNGHEQQLVLHVTHPPTMLELRQIRQQYLQWMATFPPRDGGSVSAQEIAKSFLAYVETNQGGGGGASH